MSQTRTYLEALKELAEQGFNEISADLSALLHCVSKESEDVPVTVVSGCDTPNEMTIVRVGGDGFALPGPPLAVVSRK